MTIIIGTVDNDKIYIAADSLWTWDDEFVRESNTSKFVDLDRDDVIIASAGQDRFVQILENIIEEDPGILTLRCRKDVRKLSKILYKEVHKCGVGDSNNNELPEHEFGFLIATKYSPIIWSIEPDYSVQEYEDHVCIGSGGFLGESSMRSFAKAKITGRQAVYMAVETVCELHPYCGGRIEIQEIKLDPSVFS